MAVHERYKFQYLWDQALQVPHEGREWKVIIYEKPTPKVARITLNRPERRNAFNDNLFLEMLAAYHKAFDDANVRAIIIRGAGAGFCSGHDLSGPRDEHGRPDETPPVPPDMKPTMRDYFNVERRRCTKHRDILFLPKVTIAQVHGFAIGAGEFVAASCDLTIAAEDAVLGQRGFGRMTEGVHNWPGAWPWGSQFQRGGTVLQEIGAKDAARVHLINKTVPADRLDDEALTWAKAIAEIPADALALTKEFLNGCADISGISRAWRSHHARHIALQFIRFPEGEVNFYKLRRDKGLKGYFSDRKQSATPEALRA